MKITIQKTMNVQDPTWVHNTDAGLGLHVPDGQDCLVRPDVVYTIDLGIRTVIPDGYYGQLTLSSSASHAGLTIPHSARVIDPVCRGNIKLLVTARTEPVLVAAGERICQLVILPLPPIDVEEGAVDDSTERSASGSESTGAGALVRDYGADQGTDHLTIGRLMGELQDAAFRYGNDTPVVVIADGGIGYERGDALSIINVVKTGQRAAWDQYQADRNGAPVAVIS